MMKRLFKWKRLRWFALGTLVRFLLKRTTSRSVERATADMEERLPAPDEVAREAEIKRRELKAEYLRVTEGQVAADDALLDLRPEVADEAELPEVGEPVRSGRWRAERRLGQATVNRVQRSYRPRSKPWDR